MPSDLNGEKWNEQIKYGTLEANLINLLYS